MFRLRASAPRPGILFQNRIIKLQLDHRHRACALYERAQTTPIDIRLRPVSRAYTRNPPAASALTRDNNQSGRALLLP
jgi:hypothetical protein